MMTVMHWRFAPPQSSKIGSGPSQSIHASFSQTEQVKAMCLRPRHRRGRRQARPGSLLVNNAAVAGDALNSKLWDWSAWINLGVVINGVLTLLPRMVERGEVGQIVNMASGPHWWRAVAACSTTPTGSPSSA
jgi:NAD(P)-dependent dehydrogenase (short-subunit alcohol dehydrogenase family)